MPRLIREIWLFLEFSREDDVLLDEYEVSFHCAGLRAKRNAVDDCDYAIVSPNEASFRAALEQTFSLAGPFCSSVTVTCSGHHYRAPYTRVRAATRPHVLFSLYLHTPRCERTKGPIDRWRRSIATRHGDGNRGRDEGTSSTERAGSKQASKLARNQASKGLTEPPTD